MSSKNNRIKFTAADDLSMWQFVLEEMKAGSGSELKGLLFWQKYIDQTKVQRTASNLSSHFRKQMHPKLATADLELGDIVYLYNRLPQESFDMRSFELRCRNECQEYQIGKLRIRDAKEKNARRKSRGSFYEDRQPDHIIPPRNTRLPIPVVTVESDEDENPPTPSRDSTLDEVLDQCRLQSYVTGERPIGNRAFCGGIVTVTPEDRNNIVEGQPIEISTKPNKEIEIVQSVETIPDGQRIDENISSVPIQIDCSETTEDIVVLDVPKRFHPYLRNRDSKTICTSVEQTYVPANTDGIPNRGCEDIEMEDAHSDEPVVKNRKKSVTFNPTRQVLLFDKDANSEDQITREDITLNCTKEPNYIVQQYTIPMVDKWREKWVDRVLEEIDPNIPLRIPLEKLLFCESHKVLSHSNSFENFKAQCENLKKMVVFELNKVVDGSIDELDTKKVITGDISEINKPAEVANCPILAKDRVEALNKLLTIYKNISFCAHVRLMYAARIVEQQIAEFSKIKYKFYHDLMEIFSLAVLDNSD